MATEYTVRNNDFSEYDDDPRMILNRVDRNGTHYYTDTRCPKCGGNGYIPGYEYVEGGVCFMCGGSGRGSRQVIVRTYEYNQKLVNARLEKARKTAGERNAKYLKYWGFSVEGFAWVIMGNTYEIKDQLKAAGAKWNDTFGWHFDHEVTEWPTVRVSIEDRICRLDMDGESYDDTIGRYYNDGTLSFGDEYPIKLYINSLRDKWEAEQAPATEWYGTIKDKVSLSVKLVRRGSYDTRYGTTMVYTFEDDNGHQFVWKTGTWLDNNIGDSITISGTIKDHTEYKGVKQTELTRCKIA